MEKWLLKILKMCYRGSETPMLPIQPLYHCIISVSSSALCGTGYGSKAEIDCVNREQRKSGYMSALVSYWWSCTEHWAPIGVFWRRILSLFACQWNGRCAGMEVEAGAMNEKLSTQVSTIQVSGSDSMSVSGNSMSSVALDSVVGRVG